MVASTDLFQVTSRGACWTARMIGGQSAVTEALVVVVPVIGGLEGALAKR
jgi:hypothetical protein